MVGIVTSWRISAGIFSPLFTTPNPILMVSVPGGGYSLFVFSTNVDNGPAIVTGLSSLQSA